MQKQTLTLMKTYFSQSKLARVVPFVDGDREGQEQEYYENGQLKRIVPWKNDKIHGEVKDYDKTGLLLKTTIYENDKKITVLRENTPLVDSTTLWGKLKKFVLGSQD